MLGLLCTLLILQIWLGFIVAQLVLFQLLTYGHVLGLCDDVGHLHAQLLGLLRTLLILLLQLRLGLVVAQLVL